MSKKNSFSFISFLLSVVINIINIVNFQKTSQSIFKAIETSNKGNYNAVFEKEISNSNSIYINSINHDTRAIF